MAITGGQHAANNRRILLVQSFTACTPLLAVTSAVILGRRYWSCRQQCYLHCLRTLKLTINYRLKFKNGHFVNRKQLYKHGE